MTDRRGQLIRLLETRDDHLPEPRRREQPARGFVHRTLAPTVCDVCEGVDSTGCTGCGGRGYVERLRARDPFTDTCADCLAKGLPMKGCKTCGGRGWLPKRDGPGRVLPYGFSHDHHEAARERDRQIDRLEQQTAPPWSTDADELADANTHPYGWEIARRRMWHTFDYAALDAALDALRLVDDRASTLIHEVYVYGWLTVPAVGPAARLLEMALAFLDGLMPGYPDRPLRAPGVEKPAAAVGPLARSAGRVRFDERDDRIRRRLFVDREATTVVAESEGLSVRQVNRIAAKGEAA